MSVTFTTPTLGTQNLILRGPQATDWPHWRDFAASDRAQFIGGPYDTRAAWRAFGHVIGMWVLRGFGSFIITRRGDDTPLGLTGPWYPADWPEPEIGWTIWTPEAEGKGIAYEAASAARDYAFQTLGWTTAVSYIDHGNDRSISLADRLAAVLDPDAAQPDHFESLVYRHTAPEPRA